MPPKPVPLDAIAALYSAFGSAFATAFRNSAYCALVTSVRAIRYAPATAPKQPCGCGSHAFAAPPTSTQSTVTADDGAAHASAAASANGRQERERAEGDMPDPFHSS